ncbi:transporter substrate-binding domain-containing protein [Azospirillum melinis]|uniref:Transporter substrate-binding domain-containing protein n=1 Tax=Azospirillum melinis TaxID=328839 RepID=A0ABX2KCF3_9PROT|nr:amino acid ABC transporter substrate-binding protein [Azospirillum melinis]MBP2304376.1 general L-amino acid transport system substrate-binding protein [Azospirillum melinis]NUB00859.1 transporter substrate-binding domain-containing protein [Azospirillum melinis]
MKSGFLAAAAAAVVVSASAVAGAATLDTVKQRGFVQCGVNAGLPGFGNPDSAGNWTGLDVDYCRAVAVAIFGDANKVKFTPLSAQQRFPAIQSGEVDLLSRNTTATLTRDTSVGLNFAPVTYYDGQGFMVPKKLGVKSAKELNGATVCVQSGTTTELNLADYFRANNMTYNPVVIESNDEVNAAYFAGRCDVLTTDVSGLAGTRAGVAPVPDDHVILPEVISKEPLAPAVRHGDDQWFDIVKWTIFATIQAEEFGITSKNVDEFTNSKNPDIQRFLGTSPGMGKALGLDEKWAYNVVKKVGNYAEIFDRNVGPGTPLKLERGLNALWTKGGLMYAQPFR